MRRRDIITKVIWWVYIVLLLGVVIIKFRGSFAELGDRIESTSFGTNYSLVPFATIGEQFVHFSEGWARFNILGNVIPFVPFGVLLPFVFQKANSLIKVFAIGISWVLLIELFQFFTKLGSFDVDDIVLNMIGIMGGYLMMKLVKKISGREG